ncbi:hypothetical protein [Absidia glauca]|uniref:ER-bound oxygenase mpaB/mpaB'/Rubber oxygenase catalytic domain-containing protein n=1 Tax=Absidia glauca TaxID=4829 RepID=A0A168N7W4_ABSGL|nr:hypothetical protein [Absidia glauca]
MDCFTQLSIPTWMLLGLAVYCGIVRFYRYKSLNDMIKKYPDPNTILHNNEAANEIYGNVFRREFPNVARTSMEFSLFKTFVIPNVSKLLVATGEFANNCTKRAEDTEIILSEMIDAYPRIQNHLMQGHTVSEKEVEQQHHRHKLSVERLNQIHGRYPIRNSDFVYTLALFLADPIQWIEDYEWRPLDIREINAIWYDLGLEMNIKDIPESVEGLLKFKEDHEDKEIAYSPTNWKVALPTIEHLLTRLPKFLWPAVFKFLPCLLDKRAIGAFGIEAPSWFIQLVFKILVRGRALFIRYFCLPRRQYLLRTPFHANEDGRYVPHFFLYKPEFYHGGYCIPELGPEKMRPKTCPIIHRKSYGATNKE